MANRSKKYQEGMQRASEELARVAGSIPSVTPKTKVTPVPLDTSSDVPAKRKSSFRPTKRQKEMMRAGFDRFSEDLAISRQSFEISIPQDVLNSRVDYQAANTINPSRPRAKVVAYNSETKVLIIIFRDGTWWQYNDVPSTMWIGLQNAPSTGKYLRATGLDGWPNMGPADMNALPESVKVQLNFTAMSAGRLQQDEPNTPNERPTKEQ